MYRTTAHASSPAPAQTEPALVQRQADGHHQRAFDAQRDGQPRAVELHGQRHGDGAERDRQRVERRAPIRLPQPPRDRAMHGGHRQAQHRRAGQPDVLDRRVQRRDQRVAVGVLQHVVGAAQHALLPEDEVELRQRVQREDGDRRHEVGRQPPRRSGASRPTPSAAARPRPTRPSATRSNRPAPPDPRTPSSRQSGRPRRPRRAARGCRARPRGRAAGRRPARSTRSGASRAARVARAGSAGTGRRRA